MILRNRTKDMSTSKMNKPEYGYKSQMHFHICRIQASTVLQIRILLWLLPLAQHWYGLFGGNDNKFFFRVCQESRSHFSLQVPSSSRAIPQTAHTTAHMHQTQPPQEQWVHCANDGYCGACIGGGGLSEQPFIKVTIQSLYQLNLTSAHWYARKTNVKSNALAVNERYRYGMSWWDFTDPWI